MQIQIFKELRMKEVRLVRRLLQYNSSGGGLCDLDKGLGSEHGEKWQSQDIFWR